MEYAFSAHVLIGINIFNHSNNGNGELVEVSLALPLVHAPFCVLVFLLCDFGCDPLIFFKFFSLIISCQF